MNTTDSVFRILQVIGRREALAHAAAQRSPYHGILKRLLWLLFAFPLVASLLLLSARYALDAPWLSAPSIVSLAIAYVGFIVQPLIGFFLNRKSLAKSLRHPFGVILNNARTTARIDAKYLPRLALRSIATLEVTRLELKSERDFFEKRLGLVCGAIDKLGIFPGMLAAFISISQIKSGAPWWLMSLAYAIPVLYFVAVFAHYLVMRMERQVQLIDLAIARKKAAPPEPVPAGDSEPAGLGPEEPGSNVRSLDVLRKEASGR